MPKNWKLPKRKQPVWGVVRRIIKPFVKVKTVEFEGERFPDTCIIVSNHNNKKGPVVFEINLPIYHVTWGAHQMLGNYKDRFLYLRDVFYMQKNGIKKFKATLRAGFEAIFSIFFYKGIKVLPTYPDRRFLKTIRWSMQVLESGAAISLYPEDSDEGYFDVMTHFHPGFIMLSNTYYNKTGIDLPVFPMYYGRKKNKIVVGKPLYVQELTKQGLTRDEIAETFKDRVNNLFHKYFKE
jgi:hypothetical protein